MKSHVHATWISYRYRMNQLNLLVHPASAPRILQSPPHAMKNYSKSQIIQFATGQQFSNP